MKLDKWMTSKKSSNSLLGQDPYFEIEPTFCKDGIYKQGGKCWFEVNGAAYTYPVERFIYDFNILEVNEYDNKEIKALAEVVKLGLSTKRQQKIVSIHLLHGKKLNVEDLRMRKRFLVIKEKVAQQRLIV